MKRKAKSIFRQFSPQEKARLSDLRKKLDEEKPEILAQAKMFFAAQEESKRVIAQLKAERERQGLSLADIRNRSGISREAISALENSDAPNPTLKTLQRYALALGVKLDLAVR